MVTDYYEVLGVAPDCELSQIKRAFRRKAKSFHPDLDPTGRHTSTMRILIAAYKVLSDPARRRQYDRVNSARQNRTTFNFREFLRNQNDGESTARLIFHDLLNGREQLALELFDRQVDFQLDKYFDREDCMDCLFLLAEEYEKRKDFQKSFDLLIIIVHYERELPYFRHFFREVIDRLRFLTCFEMPGLVSNDQLIENLRALIGFDFSRIDSALLFKRMAETYAEEDAYAEAERYLNEGLKLHDKLPGIQKLKERLVVR